MATGPQSKGVAVEHIEEGLDLGEPSPPAKYDSWRWYIIRRQVDHVVVSITAHEEARRTFFELHKAGYYETVLTGSQVKVLVGLWDRIKGLVHQVKAAE